MICQFICQFISKIYCFQFCEIYYTATKQNKCWAQRQRSRPGRAGKSLAAAEVSCGSAPAILPTPSSGGLGPRGQRRTTVRAKWPRCAMRLCPPYAPHSRGTAPRFCAPHSRGKELEWRHSSFAKIVTETTGGTNGIRFQGQRQGGALRCAAEHPAAVGD